ncbi:anhydro-N-acetylmuramic acid kinase [Methylobrevis pamukkalensis]|uniref:Anhydro-N-acetylmuramic acid kinase n=1 Tax=Methylobrevis pamukkalensis TaxID=1439726 RepID=A0A1E3H0F3_9HYPH|nr:anhydro-N-acetylmuramic acid kinase [Methylobrevis pamukkalensis]ODN69787.1 Anhydro-N-acetylmuramic acid kinase [Methylobrevis pamukkalensis]
MNDGADDGYLWALGLMSGTSMDGVDAAVIRTDGERIDAFGPTFFRPYTDDERTTLRAALAEARHMTDRNARPPALAGAEKVVTDAHRDVVRRLAALTLDAGAIVDLVGFHGQTVFHAPERGLTVQIGDGARLARETGLPVVHDLRAADVGAGGQGAPLVPVYHRALAAHVGLDLPVAILNLGGVANITLLDAEADPVAFDTGPANALMDDLLMRREGLRFDDGGRIAASGSVDELALARLMAHPHFAAPWPKSLDRDAFDAGPVDHLATPDALATLAAFTAASIAAAVALLPARPRRIVAAGGGANNPELLRHIALATALAVTPAGSLGLSGNFLEAEAFAFLAVRSRRGLPLTFPGTTGVARPTTGGLLALPLTPVRDGG